MWCAITRSVEPCRSPRQAAATFSATEIRVASRLQFVLHPMRPRCEFTSVPPLTIRDVSVCQIGAVALLEVAAHDGVSGLNGQSL
jgi:hypothetical protein